MKKLTVYYDVSSGDGNLTVKGETCTDITMSDDNADAILSGSTPAGIYKRVETVLRNIEALKGYKYVNGSLKCAKVIDRW